MPQRLTELENQSIFIIRESYAKIGKLALLWSMGKDSTVMLHLVRKAFLGHCPIAVLHVDTSYKIPEMITWRDEFARRHGLPLIVAKNSLALAQGMGPEHGRLNCCQALKTDALLDAVEQNHIQGLLVGIRSDEEGSRSKERIVSPRSPSGKWYHKEQPAEIWHYYNLHLKDVEFRIHPLLRWTEIDVWEYIARENLEVMPLYYATDGLRYRSLGCAPCTGRIASQAVSVAEIIAELYTCGTSERAGRAQDKVQDYAMQHLRRAGYM